VDKKPLFRKCLAVGIILLFVGVAIAPSINVNIVKASNDNDLVEITTQACGIKGFGNTTVKLTRQQYQNLEQYLVGFRARLNQTTTREEAIPIFKETVVELNKYELLPKGMSVQKAEKLVTGEYLNKKIMNALELFAKKNMFLNEANYLCLTVGHIFNPLLETPLTVACTPFLMIALFILVKEEFGDLNQYPILEFLLINCLAIPSGVLAIILYSLAYINPVSMIFVGDFRGCNLSTIGVLGLRTFNGSMDGMLFGFVGLKLMVNGLKAHDLYLLGFSLAIREEPQTNIVLDL
jgi:hypothetical protein